MSSDFSSSGCTVAVDRSVDECVDVDVVVEGSAVVAPFAFVDVSPVSAVDVFDAVESVVSAMAIPCPVAMAVPTLSATAKPPTRPICAAAPHRPGVGASKSGCELFELVERCFVEADCVGDTLVDPGVHDAHLVGDQLHLNHPLLKLVVASARPSAAECPDENEPPN